MYKKIYHFFDRLEDHTRGFLSKFPIWYALFAGAGIVIFWRGIWHSMDFLMTLISAYANYSESSINLQQLLWWDGPLSILIGTLILLITGTLVSNFIGNEILISGVKGEKKLSEKTEDEVKIEAKELIKIKQELKKISNIIKDLKDHQTKI